MRNRATAWLSAGASFLLFGSASWPLPRLFGLEGTRALVLRLGLLGFGLVIAVLLLLFLLRRVKQAPVTGVGAADIDTAIATAEARLATGRSARDARLGRLPMAIVLGPTGSTKSSIITHGGLSPDLLSGEVMRGDAVIPTDPMNVWYADGTVFLEAGGSLLDDAERWNHLARRLRPRRLAAAVGRGSQAPRVAVLCIGCDEFLRPGASQALATTARLLRTRLAELSQQLGIRLPVYVMFTRADRLPHFNDFVRSFTGDEAQQVLGATLPIMEDAGGTWAEREARRLNDAFGRMLHAMSLRRLQVLPRESQEDVRAGAYEFPRELRKIAEPAVQLLLDVFRPSQLGVNPFLRGFYFTGVRPIVLRDVADALPSRPGPTAMDAGATSVFNAAMMQQAAQGVPVMSTSGRKVPQWVFLNRWFRDVLLKDDAAMRITGGGTRVDLLRRGLIASAAAAGIVLSLGFTTSFFLNRSMISEASAALRDSRDVGTIRGNATEEELERLDALRASAARLSHYGRNGRPARYGWGLYTGERIQPAVRTAYFTRFDAGLWGTTRDNLQAYLQRLPAEPTPESDFGQAQDALAAYLLTTRRHDLSTTELLTPTLLRFWQRRDASDTLRVRAERQFAFFADELPHGNPYGTAADDALVSRTQQFLLAFGSEAYYRALIFEANSAASPVRYTGPANVVRNDYVVPGAFTRAGMSNVEANLENVEDLFLKYEWIYGSGAPRNKPNRDELKQMYEADYVRQWQSYLGSGSIARFESTADAAGKLRTLADGNSPLVEMLAVAARQTPVDTVTTIGRAFQPLHAAVPVTDPRGPAANLIGYSNQLNTLQAQLSMLASAPPASGDEGWRQASSAAAMVRGEVSSLAATFMSTGSAAQTSRDIQRLLAAPAEAGQSLVQQLPAAGVNAAGQRFCSQFTPLQRAYPFNPRAANDAAVRDVSEFFRRDDGVLWTFYKGNLAGLLTPTGRPAGTQNVNADFQRFFRRAAEFSNALYKDGGPMLVFDFVPVQYPEGATEVLLELNRQTTAFTRNRNNSFEATWNPDRGVSASIVVQFGSERVEVASATGEWAVFKVFRNTNWSYENGRWVVTWTVPGRNSQLKAFVDFLDENREQPVLRESFFAGFACSGRILN